MATEIIQNTREGEEPPTPPRREDGSLYPYLMYFDGLKSVAFADSPEELLAVLIPDYASKAEESDRLVSRILLATTAQTAVQAAINASIEAEQPEVWATLTEAERGVLLSDRVEQPHGWGDGLMGDVWTSEVPIVLVETGYAPYTAHERPMSSYGDVEEPENILWLRPMDEWEFLRSLARAGYIGLHEATDL